jgi:hypothetical protein
MANVPFPASETFKPSKRDFTLGQYPTKVYRALSGNTVKRSYGNKPHSYQLSLQYENISDDKTLLLINHYNDTSGGFTRFTLPPLVFSGMSGALRDTVRAPDNIRWEYSSPPKVQSVYNGISTVSIDLTGEINV